MSPNVGNFVHDLVEMAKAVEVLPKIEAELEDTRHQLNDAQQQVQARELRLIDLNKKLEELTAKLQSAEASRDDAEYRFLEIDEKFTKIRSLVGEIQGNADQIATQAAPEQPKEEPKAEETQHQDQSNPTSEPTPSWAMPTPQNEYPTEASMNTQQASEVAPPDPTANSMAGDGHSPSTADTPTNVQSIDAASTHNDSFRSDNNNQTPSNKPYLNRRYEDYPRYVEFRDWIAGGGTEYDYHYRSAGSRQGTYASS